MKKKKQRQANERDRQRNEISYQKCNYEYYSLFSFDDSVLFILFIRKTLQ